MVGFGCNFCGSVEAIMRSFPASLGFYFVRALLFTQNFRFDYITTLSLKFRWLLLVRNFVHHFLCHIKVWNRLISPSWDVRFLNTPRIFSSFFGLPFLGVKRTLFFFSTLRHDARKFIVVVCCCCCWAQAFFFCCIF